MNTKKVNTTSTVTVQKHAANSCIGVKNNKKCVQKLCVQATDHMLAVASM